MPPRKKASVGKTKDEGTGWYEDAGEELKKKGIYYITGLIDTGDLVEIQQDVLLKHLDPKWTEDIQLIINSCGGEVAEGWALIDLLKYIKMDVRTVGLGECQSLGACLLAAGTLGKRVAAPNCSIMIHGCWTDGYIKGNKDEMVAQMKWVHQEHARDIRFWIEHSKYTTPKQIEKAFLNGKDQYLTPKEALRHKIIDGIVGQEEEEENE